jgi:hypothetical protein
MNDLSPIIKTEVFGLPEIGKIKIGGKGEKVTSRKGNVFRMPEKHDFFTVTTCERDKNDDLIKDKEIHKELERKQYGNKPKKIPVMLLYNKIENNYQSRYACYNKKQPICVGDGTIAYRIDKKTDKLTDKIECPCNLAEEGRCKIHSNLSVLMNLENIMLGGVWKFRTGGFHSTRGMLQSLTFIQSATGGVLAGIPLVMTVRPQTALVDGKNMTIYVVGVFFDGGIQKLKETSLQIAQNNAIHQIKLDNIEENAKKQILHERSLMIEAPDIVDEFHPENNIEPITEPEITEESPKEEPEIKQELPKEEESKKKRKKRTTKKKLEAIKKEEEIIKEAFKEGTVEEKNTTTKEESFFNFGEEEEKTENKDVSADGFMF